jgi:predicted transcriptional regulator
LSISAAAQTKVSQTVKLDGELYVRLSAYAAAMRFTNQYIFVEALTEFLDRYDGTAGKGVPI